MTVTFSYKLKNNIDRQTKHSLPLTKLTNLSSAVVRGLICRLKNI